jgi:hypothetical protein
LCTPASLNCLSSALLPCSSLYPNVDFYSGIVLRALGIPVEMYTVLFAMARTVGWVAQVGGGVLASYLVLPGCVNGAPRLLHLPYSLCLTIGLPTGALLSCPAVEGDGG